MKYDTQNHLNIYSHQCFEGSYIKRSIKLESKTAAVVHECISYCVPLSKTDFYKAVKKKAGIY